jgi:hypothetical protein
MNTTGRQFVHRGAHEDAPPRRRSGYVDARAIARSMATGLLYLAAAGLGAVLSFDFGMRAGGTWLAVIAALQGAVFATLMVDAVQDGLQRLRRQPAATASDRH